MKIDAKISAADLVPAVTRTFELAIAKSVSIDRTWDEGKGTPVYTVAGKYATRGWTEWTQGFLYGNAILAFDATGDSAMLELGRSKTVRLMAPHLSHTGVHDHGFNNLSTYGNLRRLMLENRIPHNEWQLHFYELALKLSGAAQGARWAEVADGHGYVYSFNGPHSLFIDTMRTIRIMGVAHQLGHVLMGEGDRKINLLQRSIQHGMTTAAFSVYYGEGRDGYDVPRLAGRTTHEAVFNRNDGKFRCPNSQQGFSPFTTWTRGLAWSLLGYAEELEFIATLAEREFAGAKHSKKQVIAAYERAAKANAEFYIVNAAAKDGVPYWDTGAPALWRLGEDVLERDAEPENDWEPVDSSAAAIAAQGLIRLGRYLGGKAGAKYVQAGLTTARTLMAEPYLSTSGKHQGLLLHTVYHRPNGWDFVPKGRKIPCGESALWGDYHLLELANLVLRLGTKGAYPTFF